MAVVKNPVIIKKLFYKMVWNFPRLSRDIYLTFDDGPTPGITPWVLEQLEQFNAKATFFCIGKKVEKHPDLFQKVINHGHSIGNHSYSHLNGWKTKRVEYFNDVQLAKNYIDSNLYRPPYGKIKPSQKKALMKNYKIVMWDVLSGDYDFKVSKQQCATNVINNAKAGSIILFHDSADAKENLFYALPKVMEKFHRKGYCFRAIK